MQNTDDLTDMIRRYTNPTNFFNFNLNGIRRFRRCKTRPMYESLVGRFQNCDQKLNDFT